MITFPNAKINLGLQVTGKLPNGYHTINTGLYPIPWSDVLEVVPNKKTSFSSTGIEIPGKQGDDIVVKAYKLLKRDFQLPELSIHLHKQVSIGAGLGGGSADAAFMLKLLNNEFQLFLDEEVIEDYAAQLGSDCPFFVRNQPALATGTGTTLSPIDLDLGGMHMLLINPGIHISTEQAYAGIQPKPAETDLENLLLSKDFDQWKEHLTNDFEEAIFQQFPEIEEIKKQLYALGANYAAMSGSGSTVYGLFDSALPDFQAKSHDWVVKRFTL